MSQFKVEKGISLPMAHSKGAIWDYPFDSMEVGDSFFVPCEREDRNRKCTRVRSHAKNFMLAHRDVDFQYHLTKDGVRCWRVK